ncbi:anthranilate synthase component I family protein [Sediminitomix flava]|uniref:Para-aminobenzoate synthetase component 1 n=1 Tax=Sediminitomix flava TaxID=379075 RepID=A0A315YW24_SEDFL|nr:anthranilate synthase component I family protein [Sediminitomix flava]PWJ34105.1 para-aminobenzoate synthetase component 1 [Sediminitomix flava]
MGVVGVRSDLGKWLSFEISNMDMFKKKALQWAMSFDVFSFLEHNNISYPNQPFENLLAVGVKSTCSFEQGDTFETLQKFHNLQKSWLFGFFTYDLKNEVEDLESHNPDSVDMPKAHFFQPKHLFRFSDTHVDLLTDENHEEIISQIEKLNFEEKNTAFQIPVTQKINRDRYLEKVRKVQQHIVEGDVYELNFCMEFFAEEVNEDPLDFFLQLNALSPMPFASFLRVHDKFLISASPERFLRKIGQKLITQPIKGTIRRGKDAEEDKLLRYQLRNDEKEIAENMMIVDLVRNDLARSSHFGTVKVAELFGIYAFRQVHQMITTVESQLREEYGFATAIKNAFPMGSMTGAPKVMSMELIEKYEESKRGLYSGSVGYITPEGDFDFNVVIRSLQYNTSNKYLSFQVGGAITIDAVPEKEYEECLLKAKAIMNLLNQK